MTNYHNFFIQTVARSATNLCSRVDQAESLPQDVYTQALTLLELAFQPQVASQVWPTISELILTLSPKVEQSGHWDEWLVYLKQALALSQIMDEPQIEAALSIQLGIFLQRRGEFETAQTHLYNGIKLAQATDDRASCVAALNRLAFIAELQAKNREAVHYLEQVIALTTAQDPQRALTYLLLGRVAHSWERMEKAVEYLRASIRLSRKNEDTYQMALGLGGLGVVLREQNRLQDALDVYEECMELWTTLDNPIEQAIITLNKGVVHEAMGDLQLALDCYDEAKPILEKSQNGHNLAKLYNNQGYCYAKLALWNEAEKSYQASLTQAYPLENWFAYANTLDGLGVVYHAQGKYEQAVRTFQEALHHLSKVVDSNVTKNLAQEIRQHLHQSQR